MRKTVLLIITTLVVVAIVVYAIVRSRSAPEQLQNASVAPVVGTAQVGRAAPQFSVPTTAGTLDLSKERRPVLLEVFATWCPHCQRETAVMNRLYEGFKASVAFVAVPGSTTGMDGASPESQADIFAFMQRFSVAYPIAIYDPQLTVANQYLQGGYPTIAVIGKDKRVLYITSGEVAYETVASELKKAISAR